MNQVFPKDFRLNFQIHADPLAESGAANASVKKLKGGKLWKRD